MHGLLAYGLAEAGTRVLRVFTIIVIARQIAPAQIGIAALALALFEFVRVLANSGIGQRIIAATDAELASICNAAHRLFYLWCGGVALVQLACAAIMWRVFGQAEIAAMLAMLTGVYALMPAGLVQVFLLMRSGRLATTARIAATQTTADHFLCLALALVWPSAWALVLPKLLTAPVWLVLVRRAQCWSPIVGVAAAPLHEFTRLSAGVLVTEFTNVARQQLDKIIVGAMLGTEALGFYFFAFNAGLGITSSFVSALSIVLFPYLCAARSALDRMRRLKHSIMLGLGLFTPVVIAQVLLADIYVPILFGEQWADIAPLVAILCLAAIPAITASVSTAWLRATGGADRDAMISIVVCIAALGALALGCTIGLHGAAWAYVLALWAVQLPITAFVLFRGLGLSAINNQTPKGVVI
ncbi:oligosaccharide flippase family protein [Alteraurantiacibacter aestuarii]|uniref:oligosaccharide flippase family protein n=1 Tax=Alteraurantiacibacter aestuarii TaxID=650004 RepID=UPI001F457426|nr:oligosaccharide flippase family protein [Alteraurantiacibacter aestuarii]